MLDDMKMARAFSKDVVTDPHFLEQASTISEWIDDARKNRANPIGLLTLQAKLASEILGQQNNRKEFKKILTRNDLGSVERRDYEKAVAKATRVVRIVKDIANGIAWRALDYDRPLLRQLSMKPQTGALERSSFEIELEEAARASLSTGRIAILADLTDFLRFGDYVLVGDTELEIREVKGGRGSRRSGRASRQRQTMARKVSVVNRGYGDAADGTLARMVTHGTAASNAHHVARLLEESRSIGTATAAIGDSLNVQVLRLKRMIELQASIELETALTDPNHLKYNTLRFFHRQALNLVPLSIYPYQVEDRADVLVGGAVIVSDLDVDGLMNKMRARGFAVDFPSESLLESQAGLLPGEIARHELDAPVRIMRKGHPALLSVSLAVFSRVVAEFLDEESFLAHLEQTLDSADEPTLLYSQYENEHELWD